VAGKIRVICSLAVLGFIDFKERMGGKCNMVDSPLKLMAGQSFQPGTGPYTIYGTKVRFCFSGERNILLFWGIFFSLPRIKSLPLI